MLWILVFLLIALLVALLFFLNRPVEPIANGVKGLNPVMIIVGPGSGDKPKFARPLAAAWGPAGDIYISDTGNARITVFNGRGRFLREFGRVTTDTPKAQRAGELNQPAGIAVSGDGTVFVADLRGGRVVVFNKRGRLLRSIRPPVSKGSSGWAPTDVALSEGVIAVTDAEGVVLFSEEGELRGRLNEVSPGSPFVRPNGIAFADDGALVISDTNQQRVVSMSTSGELFWVLGGNSDEPQAIGLPRGLSVADDGSIMVTDAFRFSIARISGDGEFLDHYGQRGDQPGSFEYPNDVDLRKDRALVADKENNRVQVLRLDGILGTGGTP